MSKNHVIGDHGSVPWNLPEDLSRFSRLTRGHTVLMGRKTYDSLPDTYKPLPGRRNVVVTRHPAQLKVATEADLEIIDSPIEFIKQAREIKDDLSCLWIIGGGEIYNATISEWDELYLTLIHATYNGDTFFPDFEDRFRLVEEEVKEGFSYLRYVRP